MERYTTYDLQMVERSSFEEFLRRYDKMCYLKADVELDVLGRIQGSAMCAGRHHRALHTIPILCPRASTLYLAFFVDAVAVLWSFVPAWLPNSKKETSSFRYAMNSNHSTSRSNKS